MPWSAEEGKDFVRSTVRSLRPSSVLDVGAGAGYYGTLVRKMDATATIHAIEIWQPYVERFSLGDIYDEIFVCDAREFEPTRSYDLVILGDIMEHMTQDEAVSLLDRLREHAKNIIISLPIIEWHQGECEGNPFEAHVHHWDDAQATQHFQPVQSWTGPNIGVYVLSGTNGM